MEIAEGLKDLAADRNPQGSRERLRSLNVLRQYLFDSRFLIKLLDKRDEAQQWLQIFGDSSRIWMYRERRSRSHQQAQRLVAESISRFVDARPPLGLVKCRKPPLELRIHVCQVFSDLGSGPGQHTARGII